jgi:hypothetical protein
MDEVRLVHRESQGTTGSGPHLHSPELEKALLKGSLDALRVKI